MKSGNAVAVNLSFPLLFPFLFMTTRFLPRKAMTYRLSTVADYNPVTYLQEAMVLRV